MKKWLIILVVFMFTLVLYACSNAGEGTWTTGKNDQSASEATASTQQFAIGVPVTEEPTTGKMDTQPMESDNTQLPSDVAPDTEPPETAQAPTADSTEEATTIELTQDEKIAQIKAWYSELVDATPEVFYYGDAAAAFWLNGNLVKGEIYELIDPESVDVTWIQYEYYYHDSDVYFAHIIGYGNRSDLDLRLYFWEGRLIRWIEKDGVKHDSSHESYQQYYEDATWHFAALTEKRMG